LPQLLEALGLTEFGTVGSDFSSQLQFLQSGFSINGTDKAGQAKALADLGAKFSPVLQGIFDANDLSGSRSRLAGLFQRLNDGGVSANEIGGLTGMQFADLLRSLIGAIDDVGAGSSSAPPPLNTGTNSDTVYIPGAGNVSTGSADSLIASVTTLQTTLLAPLVTIDANTLRTAVATEMTAAEVGAIRGWLEKMGGGTAITGVVDKALEQTRRNTAMDKGQPPMVG
jgi:hypothetical protein